MSESASLLDWAEKHRPQRLAEVVGNKAALDQLLKWAQSWTSGVPEQRAVILAGSPGVGKTTAALALAREMGWTVVEMNASDDRNEDALRRVAGAGSVNRSLFSTSGDAASGKQLIILDEADNLFGNEDRGGAKAISDIVRETRQPLILIANDLYELQRRSSALKSLALVIKFQKVHSASIPAALRAIAAKEGITLEPGVDKALAERAGGDMRSAVNDLQGVCAGRTSVTLANVEALGRRDEVGDVWGMLGEVFYGRDLEKARRSIWDLDETPESISLWIDENLPILYQDKADLVDGYRALARADLFLGRAKRRQQFHLWSYANELMTAGVSLAKVKPAARDRFQFPSWLRKQSASRGMRELRKRTALKVAAATHTSGREARSETFPALRALMENDGFAAWAIAHFELEADEAAFVLDAKPTDTRMKKLIEAAAALSATKPRAATDAIKGFAGSGEGDDAVDDAPAADRTTAASKKTKAAAKTKTAKAKPRADDEEADAPDEPQGKGKQKGLFEF
ncbi:MAG: replication factor C large subunit [Thermoplasmatota archaeon]